MFEIRTTFGGTEMAFYQTEYRGWADKLLHFCLNNGAQDVTVWQDGRQIYPEDSRAG